MDWTGRVTTSSFASSSRGASWGARDREGPRARDLAPVLLTQADAATRPDADARTHPQAESAADAHDVEVEQEPERRMRQDRRQQERKAPPRAWAGSGVEDAGGWQHETTA